jgi:two-component system sensor histidine kinase RegB
MIVIASVLAFLVQFVWHVDVPGLSMHGHSHMAGPEQMLVEHSPAGHHETTGLATPSTSATHEHDGHGSITADVPHAHHEVVTGSDARLRPTGQSGTTPNDHDAHLRGMFIAFAVAAGFISWFVQRINRDLESLMRELEQERRRRTDAERLRSLGTLAAGAAHELATPLSTIRLIAGELLHQADTQTLDASTVKADLTDMQAELARCSRILEQMAVRSGDVAASFRAVAPLELANNILQGLPGSGRVRVDTRGAGSMVLPADGVAHAVRSVLKNALQADEGTVELKLERQPNALHVEVRDRGVGMEPAVLARFGEPFFTTRREGDGMGLGAYLTRRVVEDLGGAMRVDSEPGRGTTITLMIPVQSTERSMERSV